MNYFISSIKIKKLFLKLLLKKWNFNLNEMGIGDWGLGPIPNPQSPIPNPQSPLIFIYNLRLI